MFSSWIIRMIFLHHQANLLLEGNDEPHIAQAT
jgi:hypothetical protein